MTERDPKLEEARDRLENVVKGLAGRFGPEETARLLGGALLGLLMGTAGRVSAIEFVEGLAAQLREDHPENWPAES